jgi:hypothetical protein
MISFFSGPKINPKWGVPKFTDVNFIQNEGPPYFFHRFSAADYDSVLSFWGSPQWLFQKHWKCPNWVTPKRYNKIFPKIQSIRGFFGNKCSFQKWFWNLSSTSNHLKFEKSEMPGNFQVHVWRIPLIPK